MDTKNSGKEFYLLDESDILFALKKHLLIEELQRDVILADLLGKVSSVFQFDIPYYGRRKTWSDTREYLKDLELLRSKGLINYIGTDLYTLNHSLDASYTSMVLADNFGAKHDEYTSKKIGEYLNELPINPQEYIVDNLTILFKTLNYSELNDFKCNRSHYSLSLFPDYITNLEVNERRVLSEAAC